MEFKLYVWNEEGFLEDYTSGMAVAVARSEAEAIATLVAKGCNESDFYGFTPKILPLTEACGFFVHGGA